MKKKIITLLMFTCIIAAKAQITTTNSHFPRIGDSQIDFNDSLTSMQSPGSAGTNQTWNFSNLHQHTSDTTTIVSVSSTASAAQFPNAKFAALQGSSGQVGYLDTTPSQVNLIGIFGNFSSLVPPLAINYSSPDILFKSGITYHSNYSFTTSLNKTISTTGISLPAGVTADSGRLFRTQTVYRTIDGWGNITTPEGTFPCLRARDSIVTTTKIDLHVFVIAIYLWQNVSNTTTHSITYNFIDDNSIDPVLTLNMDSTSNTVGSATYRKAQATGIGELVQKSQLSIYPNPSNQSIFISQPSMLNSIEISNVLGQVVLSNKSFSKTDNSIDVSNLLSGVYFVKTTDETGKQYLGKFVKE